MAAATVLGTPVRNDGRPRIGYSGIPGRWAWQCAWAGEAPGTGTALVDIWPSPSSTQIYGGMLRYASGARHGLPVQRTTIAGVPGTVLILYGQIFFMDGNDLVAVLVEDAAHVARLAGSQALAPIAAKNMAQFLAATR